MKPRAETLILFAHFIVFTTSATNLTIGLILPEDIKYDFAIPKVLPAIEFGLDKVKDSLLSSKNITISVITKDSKYSDIYGPLAAIELHKQVDIFFGPIFGFGVAPIARYAPYWDVPIITPGAPDVNFKHKSTEYKQLTRIGAIYEDATKLVKAISQEHGWKRFGMYYHSFIDTSKPKSECYQQMWAFHEFLKNEYPEANKDLWIGKFDETEPKKTNHTELLLDARLNVRCKFEIS